ncbi:MAG: beta-glucuronidase [Prevotellaceae bacterium]|nr:beta-glucuronidase [Candidatus Minthosoma caballi]
MKRFTALLYLIIIQSVMICISAQEAIDLSGEWQFMIDREDKGIEQGWWKNGYKFDDTIKLPASMPQRQKGDDISVETKWVGSLYDSSYFFNPYMKKYRQPGKDMKLQFFLTPDKHYVGVAWYKKTVHLDENEPLPLYSLYLERPHITTQVWVNGEKVSFEKKSLSVPHEHYLYGYLKPGDNEIVVRVNNDPETVKVGQDSHSVTDQTQGCWNGLVGKLELRPFNYIDYVVVYPDVDNKSARVHLEMEGLKQKEPATITVVATSFNSDKKHTVKAQPKSIVLTDPAAVPTDIELSLGDEMLLWDEFNPQLYKLTVEVKTKDRTTVKETVFGMRKVEIKDKMFYINGKEVQLRGTVENCDFPNTGYPPCDLDSWLKLFRTCKSYGLNHIRFHSYCPPEAAFLAADMVGFYIQPEGPSWPNHGVKLGQGQPIDDYLMEEAIVISNTYGNHPSFTMFCFGNEPAGNWVKWATEHTAIIKEWDNRRVYGGFSVGGGWAWQPGSEYQVKAGARGLNEWSKRAPESMVDFRNNIAVYNGKDAPNTPINMPYISHETGQWCAFPNFKEISKYTGVNKAKNFEIFRDLLRDNGMESMSENFLLASGKLQALCYKAEIERTLRTPKYAGYQLLSLNDYSGQGTALVGVTDVFFDNKGYITSDAFREFSGPIVPLARIPKFTYSNAETFTCSVELNQHTNATISNAKPRWEIIKAADTRKPYMTLNLEAPYAEGEFAQKDLPIGSNIELGNISVSLDKVTEPTKFTLVVHIPGTEAKNHWDFWVYPSSGSLKLPPHVEKKIRAGKRPGTMWMDNILITDTLDAEALKALDKGKNVLICAAGKVSYGKEVVQQFTPVFWNTSWFKMRPPHTTGIFVENQHSIFDLFPTDYHSDMQWWELVNRAQVMQFTDFPKDFQPLVQSIDTWFVSRKIGMLFEAKVGKGKLIMTSMDITNDLDKRIVARQMRNSILNYMMSKNFAPRWTIEQQQIADLFTKVAGEVNMFTNDSPDELKPKLDNSLKK